MNATKHTPTLGPILTDGGAGDQRDTAHEQHVDALTARVAELERVLRNARSVIWASCAEQESAEGRADGMGLSAIDKIDAALERAK